MSAGYSAQQTRGSTTPGQVTAVRVLVTIQAALQMLGAAAGLAIGISDGKVALGVVSAIIGVAIGAGLLVAVVQLGGCRPWTRVAVMSFEGLIVLLDVAVMVSTGRPFGLLDMLFAAVIVGLLMTAPSRACFARAASA